MNEEPTDTTPTYHYTTDNGGMAPAAPLADIVRHINRVGFGYVTEVQLDGSRREMWEGDGWHFGGELGDSQPHAEPQGWPGDGSGEDDLADFNAMEADDYAGE